MADALPDLRAHFQAKGAAAFNHRRSRDSHGYNPGSSAISDFQIGYDSAASKSHDANSTARHVDVPQVNV
jgi:hypothetical protein